MAIYMKYGDVKGEATHDKHKDWIDIIQLNWGTGRDVVALTGSTHNRVSGRTHISQIQLVKAMDCASTKLFTEACSGNKGVEVTIDVTTHADSAMSYCTYTLSDALISSYNVSTGGERPTESLSISFTKLEFKFTPLGHDNKAGTPVTVSYDLSTTTST